MKSHNFRTHTWKKKNQTGMDHMSFLMNSTNAQRSFIHELASQQLGHPPSNMWGVPIPEELHQPADKQTLQFVVHAAKHSPHEFGRLISSHKKASGMIGDIGEAIAGFAKGTSKYLGKVATYGLAHADQIKTGVNIAKGLVQTGTTIATAAGWLHPDKKTTIDSVAAALDKLVQGEKKKEATPEPKKGGYFGKIMI